MIHLTFYYNRDVFNGSKWQKWIIDLFGNNVEFMGSEVNRFPEIKISLADFQAKKDKIPVKNLVRIEGKFTIIEQLTFGIRDFKNEI